MFRVSSCPRSRTRGRRATGRRKKRVRRAPPRAMALVALGVPADHPANRHVSETAPAEGETTGGGRTRLGEIKVGALALRGIGRRVTKSLPAGNLSGDHGWTRSPPGSPGVRRAVRRRSFIDAATDQCGCRRGGGSYRCRARPGRPCSSVRRLRRKRSCSSTYRRAVGSCRRPGDCLGTCCMAAAAGV
jgi:hypothetical protein